MVGVAVVTGGAADASGLDAEEECRDEGEEEDDDPDQEQDVRDCQHLSKEERGGGYDYDVYFQYNKSTSTIHNINM